MTRSRDVSKGATRNEFIYTATSQQTTFSGNDDNTNSLSYTVGQIDVFVNGVRQAPADYTATNGTSVVLGAGASVGDTVQIQRAGDVIPQVLYVEKEKRNKLIFNFIGNYSVIISLFLSFAIFFRGFFGLVFYFFII